MTRFCQEFKVGLYTIRADAQADLREVSDILAVDYTDLT